MILRRSEVRTKRQGNVAAMVACMLTVLLGMVGFAIDGGMLLSQRRAVQSGADAAAMAAASILYQNFPSSFSGGSYSSSGFRSAAKSEARRVAYANGFLHDASSYDGSNADAGKSKVRVRFPGGTDDDVGGGLGFENSSSIYNTGTNTKASGYEGNITDGCVEVTIHYFQSRYFSTIWGSDVIPIVCHAVAKGAFVAPEDGVIVLNYTAGQALRDTGGGSMIVIGGSFIVDSNATAALFDQGGGSITVMGATGSGQQASPEFDVTGGISIGGNGSLTTLNTNGVNTNSTYTGLHPTPDPLAYLPAPTQPAAGTITKTGGVYTLTPGYYDGTEANFPGNLNSSESIVLDGTGIYYINLPNNQFIKTTGGSITMSGSTRGVMVYMAGGALNVTGNSGSQMNLAPLPDSSVSGGSDVYQGMVFWQPVTNTNAISISGNGGVNVSGTFYAPGTSLMTITGNGTSGNGDQYGSQFVVNQLKVAGNGDVGINFKGGNAAKTRILCLVE